VAGEPTTFFMHLPEAVLAFERGVDGYSVSSLAACDRTLPKDEWDALRPRLEPTGRIPLDEIEQLAIDRANHPARHDRHRALDRWLRLGRGLDSRNEV
jgi:hypothetical protein